MALADHIRPGFPISYATDSSRGSTYEYRGPTSEIDAGTPLIGATWADALPVISVTKFEISDASGISEMTVTTGVNSAYSGVIGTPGLEQTHYGLVWRPVVRPLESHPEFHHGGGYSLWEIVDPGLDTERNGFADVMGWLAEPSAKLRSEYKYTNPGDDTELTLSDHAQAFAQLRLVGVEEYVDYMPVWRKRSIYKGSTAPGIGEIGQKTASPSGSGYPSGYEWVKSADNVERIGLSSRWRRDEEWEGCKKVFVDKDDIFLPPTS